MWSRIAPIISFPVLLISSQMSPKRPGTCTAVVEATIKARRTKITKRDCILKEEDLIKTGEAFEVVLKSVVRVESRLQSLIVRCAKEKT
jgi:hypothetical protein